MKMPRAINSRARSGKTCSILRPHIPPYTQKIVLVENCDVACQMLIQYTFFQLQLNNVTFGFKVIDLNEEYTTNDNFFFSFNSHPKSFNSRSTHASLYLLPTIVPYF